MAHTSWSRRGARFAIAVAAAFALTVATATAERVSGTSGGETLRGTAGPDQLYGRGGDDRVFGLAGSDLLDGGPGSDRLWGGPGADRIVARDRTQDLVICGPGRDVAILDLLDRVHTSCEVVRRPKISPQEPPAEPSPVALENRKPGTPGWAAFDIAPGRAIEGYTTPSVSPGDSLEFHVSTAPEATYRVLVYRAGYYGGIGARRVACLPSCDGSAQGAERSIPIPSPEGLVHAGWPISQSIQVTGDWVSGYYFAHFQLTSGPFAGRVTTTWFVVHEAPGRRAPLLVQASATTWQAYNGWGGGSLYEFNSPDGRRAAKVAFDRPYQQPLEQRPEALEVPLARFLERNGYDVAYQADVDTARDPASIVDRKVIAVAGHGEYWSKGIRDSFDAARDAGIDLAFFGANAAYWQV